MNYTLYKLYRGEYTELTTPDNYSNIYNQLEDHHAMIAKEGLTPSPIYLDQFTYFDNNDNVVEIGLILDFIFNNCTPFITKS